MDSFSPQSNSQIDRRTQLERMRELDDLIASKNSSGTQLQLEGKMVILNASHRGFRSKVLNIFGHPTRTLALVILLANVYTSCHEDGILSTDGSGEDGTTSKDGQVKTLVQSP
ncbi:hypothetical protein GBA52_015161 [Prunus armeniaca]|nr:hypothetical protein GBA52_015161 [Prunus armeniaca]